MVGMADVTKTATIGLHGNTYEVDAAMVGRKVEAVFDPFDLTDIQIRWQGQPMGAAVPYRIGRHVHHKARPHETTTTTSTATEIDYLGLVETQHTKEIAARLRYSQISDKTLTGRAIARTTAAARHHPPRQRPDHRRPDQ